MGEHSEARRWEHSKNYLPGKLSSVVPKGRNVPEKGRDESVYYLFDGTAGSFRFRRIGLCGIHRPESGPGRALVEVRAVAESGRGDLLTRGQGRTPAEATD